MMVAFMCIAFAAAGVGDIVVSFVCGQSSWMIGRIEKKLNLILNFTKMTYDTRMYVILS